MQLGMTSDWCVWLVTNYLYLYLFYSVFIRHGAVGRNQYSAMGRKAPPSCWNKLCPHGGSPLLPSLLYHQAEHQVQQSYRVYLSIQAVSDDDPKLYSRCGLRQRGVTGCIGSVLSVQRGAGQAAAAGQLVTGRHSRFLSGLVFTDAVAKWA